MLHYKGEDLRPHTHTWDEMQEKEPELNKKPEPQAESVFAKEKTFGEKKHAMIFGTAINFWVNLLSSAGFTFWVAHSTSKIKLPGMENAVAPREIQNKLSAWVENQFFMKGIENSVTRGERAHSMATLFTLLIPGHLIMIPSVWLGAKYKSAIVNHYDRKHYGDEAMQSPELQKRHELIEQEDKPTIVGAIVSRVGSFIATQLVARFIGTPDNLINKVGAKSFRGMDPIAIDIGGSIGEGLNKVAPETISKINKRFETHGYNWSTAQKKNATLASKVVGPYNQAVDNFSRYVTQDVLYTLVTSSTVHPILNFTKKFIPGLTYQSKSKESQLPIIALPQEQEIPREKPQETAQVPNNIPAATVSHIRAESTISAKPERNVSVAGA